MRLTLPWSGPLSFLLISVMAGPLSERTLTTRSSSYKAPSLSGLWLLTCIVLKQLFMVVPSRDNLNSLTHFLHLACFLPSPLLKVFPCEPSPWLIFQDIVLLHADNSSPPSWHAWCSDYTGLPPSCTYCLGFPHSDLLPYISPQWKYSPLVKMFFEKCTSRANCTTPG